MTTIEEVGEEEQAQPTDKNETDDVKRRAFDYSFAGTVDLILEDVWFKIQHCRHNNFRSRGYYPPSA